MENRLRQLACSIKAVISDVDGVFTDNRVFEGAPYKGKWRSYYDGQGTSLIRAIGLPLALITNEKDDSVKHIVEVVEKWNNLPSSSKVPGDGGWTHIRLFTGFGGDKKTMAAEEWLKEIGVSFEECAFMADDLVDMPLLERVALRAAPVSAEPAIKRMAHFVSERPGGHGAFRDFANFILEARGIDPLTLPPQ